MCVQLSSPAPRSLTWTFCVCIHVHGFDRMGGATSVVFFGDPIFFGSCCMSCSCPRHPLLERTLTWPPQRVPPGFMNRHPANVCFLPQSVALWDPRERISPASQHPKKSPPPRICRGTFPRRFLLTAEDTSLNSPRTDKQGLLPQSVF